MTAPQPTDIESILHETRLFPPREGFTAAGPGAEPVPPHIGSMQEYERLYRQSLEDPDGFWSGVARELDWFQPWEKTLEWSPPDAKWFVGGKTNICHNCVDRQVAAGLGDQTAIVWEGEPMDAGAEIRRLTYAELKREVCKFANVLKSLGVKKGDVVTIYMPMVPELAVAVLACARIGAPHSVIFGGFSAQAIVDRVVDAGSRVIITADGGWRRGQIVPLKENVDAACAQLEVVDHVVVLERAGADVVWHHEPSDAHGAKRDHWWHDLMQAAPEECPCEPMDSEDMLFVLYTSGTTGKPKGVYHTVGGYMVFTYYTSKIVFDLHPGTNQMYWCTADVGWITGHSYIIYGVLPNCVPTLMYEGAPNHPTPDRFWSIVERHKVTHFYTAPTAIRAFMKWGDDFPRKHDLSSLRVLGTVGEPINPEAWIWYHTRIGHEKCPIVDTWWQTETGGHMITPLPGATPAAPGSCTLPFFGVDAAIVDEQGEEMPHETGGLLAIRRPWPSMTRGVLGDRERFIETYWSRIKKKGGTGVSRASDSGGTGVSPASDSGGTGVSPVQSDGDGDGPTPYYFAGDGAKRDEHGYFWIMGRVDDVINVSGHRLGAAEVESALVSHESVVEAAVVGAPHEVKGEGIAAFVTLAPGFAAGEDLRIALRDHVAEQIGAIAKPDQIRFTDALPKTRSGKIMRRLLRDIAAGEEKVGDTTTLEDYSVLARLRESDEG